MNRTRELLRRRRRFVRARRGVTLIELIIASTILMLGLLSIVGVSASVARSLGEARNEALAAIAAQSRFEKLAGTYCTSLPSGVQSASSRGINERYAVIDGGNNTRMLHDTVTWVTNKVTRKAIFQTLIPCRPGA